MNRSELLNELILSLPGLKDKHSPGAEYYISLKKIVRNEIKKLFSDKDGHVHFGPFGELNFPYHEMGNIDSLNLFDLDELVIFSFYWVNKEKYKKVLDLGANLGLHSILMAKCGFDVSAYEPDPTHFEILTENILLNGINNSMVHNAAISDESGKKEFIRVLGNTTSSHIAGAKANPYGDLQHFPVDVVEFRTILEGVDLIKMDIEGHEKEVLINTDKGNWDQTDALVEIENKGNAESIFYHFKEININLFSQKCNWKRVETLEEMPASYHEGTLFISPREEMPWAK